MIIKTKCFGIAEETDKNGLQKKQGDAWYLPHRTECGWFGSF
jgi:hypothetical protein